MELLSPAGSPKAFEAAVSAGADAIYLGYTSFSARSYAGNFDEEALRNAIKTAHKYGRKVYVTVNTLIKENELEELHRTLGIIESSGADAIIVQDLAVYKYVLDAHLSLPLHASTQMTINNVQGTRLLQKLGYKRVVPARECSIEELKKMADTGMEIEAFVHGALCVCLSGQCLFSGMIGGRSGNRGKCSQPCRLPYSFSDGERGYLLSPRDLMLIRRLRDLNAAGIASLKIEGRMKSPEYVAVVTSEYRKGLDALEKGSASPVAPESVERLKQVFNRGGFTEGYAFHKNHTALMSWEKPNHQGVEAAVIERKENKQVWARSVCPLQTGDSLEIRTEEREYSFIYHGKPIPKGARFSFTLPDERIPVSGGGRVFRLTSTALSDEVKKMTPSVFPKSKLTAVLTAIPGKKPTLTFTSSDGKNVEATGENPVQVATGHPLDQASVFRQLDRLKESNFELESVMLVGEEAFLPVKDINRLRRDALEKLLETPRLSFQIADSPDFPKQERLLIVQTENLSEVTALLDAGADQVAWLPRDWQMGDMSHLLDLFPDRQVLLVLPAVTTSDELDEIHEMVTKNASLFSAVQINNLGQLDLSWPVPMVGGQGHNVMNSECASVLYSLGLTRLTASCELTAKEIRELKKRGGNYEIECYGRAQLMLLSHCPERTRCGDTATENQCNRCASRGDWCETLCDRKGKVFPLRRIRMKNHCILSLYNSVYTDMAKRGELLGSLGCSLRLSFTDETPEERVLITRSYRNLLDGSRLLHVPGESATCGQLLRGVE